MLTGPAGAANEKLFRNAGADIIAPDVNAVLDWLAGKVSGRRHESPPRRPLPITRVTLYTSGVGYFERGGEVEGDARQTLLFPVGQVNDVLKSLVLLDGGGGTIQPVTYAAQDPRRQALQAFSVDVSDNPDPATLLNRMRGRRHGHVDDATGPRPLTGMIVGRRDADRHAAERRRHDRAVSLTLLAGDGLKTVPLASVRSIADQRRRPCAANCGRPWPPSRRAGTRASGP